MKFSFVGELNPICFSVLSTLKIIILNQNTELVSSKNMTLTGVFEVIWLPLSVLCCWVFFFDTPKVGLDSVQRNKNCSLFRYMFTIEVFTFSTSDADLSLSLSIVGSLDCHPKWTPLSVHTRLVMMRTSFFVLVDFTACLTSYFDHQGQSKLSTSALSWFGYLGMKTIVAI